MATDDLQQFSAELGELQRDQTNRIDAERVTLQFGQRSGKKLDAGRRPIDESPLFGGTAQSSLFGDTE